MYRNGKNPEMLLRHLERQAGLLLGHVDGVLQAAQCVHQAVRERVLPRPHAPLGQLPHLRLAQAPARRHLQRTELVAVPLHASWQAHSREQGATFWMKPV